MRAIEKGDIVAHVTDDRPYPTLWEVNSATDGYVTASVIPAGTIPVSGFYRADQWRIVPPEAQVKPCGCEREGCNGFMRYVNDPYLSEIEEEDVWSFWCEIDLDNRRDEI
jgi:hypothetical protein